MNWFKETITVLFCLTMVLVPVFGQELQSIKLDVLHKQNRLNVHNRGVNIKNEDGIGYLKIDENNGEGLVWVEGIHFNSGIIEVDLRGQDVFQKSFIGLAFNGLNNESYEAIYFRPFNFHATDSVRKIHAVQYINHPDYPWKTLREARNGEFEKGLINPPNPNEWFHVRVEVLNTEVLVFVNADETPALKVNRLSAIKGGKLGLWVGDGSGGEFTNLKIKTH